MNNDQKTLQIVLARRIITLDELETISGALPKVAIIGGTSLAEMTDIKNYREIEIVHPKWKYPETIGIGRLAGRIIAFVSRHGRGHWRDPNNVPYDHIIYALKVLGVEVILSFTACGSYRNNVRPGDLVVLNQYVDRTLVRPRSFFGDGVVAHVSFADPICETNRRLLLRAADVAVRNETARTSDLLWHLLPRNAKNIIKSFSPFQHKRTVHDGGTYVCISGPAFSTRAESRLFRMLGLVLGWHVVGMTNFPEAPLAREAGICYVSLAVVCDFDSWKARQPGVSGDEVHAAITKTALLQAEVARQFVRLVILDSDCTCHHSLSDGAIHTNVEKVDLPYAKHRARELLDYLQPLLQDLNKTKSGN